MSVDDTTRSNVQAIKLDKVIKNVKGMQTQPCSTTLQGGRPLVNGQGGRQSSHNTRIFSILLLILDTDARRATARRHKSQILRIHPCCAVNLVLPVLARSILPAKLVKSECGRDSDSFVTRM